MSGHWPPEWEDSEEEFTEGTDQSDTPVLDETSAARLSEVAAYLASVPVPPMPDAVEARINAALAAEAATRGARPAPDSIRKLGPAPARARVRRPGLSRKGGGDRPRRRFRVRLQVVGGSLFTCLLLAFLGFALSHVNLSSASSSGPASGSAAGTSNSSAASSAAGGSVPGARPSALGPQHASFTVTASGTRYQEATLAEQVRGRLAANGSAESPATGAGSTPAGNRGPPSAALRGCVLRVTGGAVPRLVDRATYQGEPAYVIASSARVWVVEPGCTAAITDLIVSVALAGLPGNLRALVSVEQ
jgi:hypothetical protein